METNNTKDSALREPKVRCSALLACPWQCKGVAIYENYGSVGWHVECPECGARGPWGEDKCDARQQWNKLPRQANGEADR